MPLVEVQGDPFAASAAPAGRLVPVEGNPFDPPIALQPGERVLNVGKSSPLASESASSGAGALAGAEPDLSTGPTAPGRGLGTSLGEGVHDVGRGLAGLAGLPVDFGQALGNTAIYLANKATGSQIPAIRKPILGRENNMSAADTLLSFLQVPDVPADQKTMPEKLVSNINEIGTQAAASWPLAVRAAVTRAGQTAIPGALPRVGDAFLQPYMEAPMRAAALDTAASTGAGTMLTATQAVPEEYRKAGGGYVGALLDFLGMAAGAAGGGVGGHIAVGGPGRAADLFHAQRVARDIPLDPETRTAVTNRVADRAAAFAQGNAADPGQAAADIAAAVRYAEENNLPMPTTGIASGDRGLIGIEQGQRTKQSTASLFTSPKTSPATKAEYSFGARDTALRDAAVGEVNRLGPENARPGAFIDEAGKVRDERLGARQQALDEAAKAEEAIAEQRRAEAVPVAIQRGQQPVASQALDTAIVDKGLKPATTAKNELYNAIDPEGTIQRPVAPLAERVAAIRKDAEALPESLRSRVLPEGVLSDIEKLAGEEGTGTMPFRGMVEMRPVLAEMEGQARQAGQFRLADNLRGLRNEIGAETERLAAEGNTAAQAADQNYRQNFAPNWAAGPGDAASQLRRDVNRDPNSRTLSPPSQTAGRFLQPGQVEKAESLNRVMATSQTPQAAADAARQWLFADLAGAGVMDAKTSTLRPDMLRAWRDRWGPVLDQVPGVKQEVNDLINRSSVGETLNDFYTRSVAASRKELIAEGKDIQQGALGLVLGKDPEHAIAGVFGSANPKANMTELVNSVGRNEEARQGLKRAVADYFVNKVSSVAPQNVTEGTQNINFAQLVKQFEKNRDTLATVFNPAEMNALTRAQKLLEPLAQRAGQATVGSPTAERNQALERTIEVGLKLYFGMLKGGGINRTLKLAWQAATGKGAADIDRLVARMMFDPELAQHLLTRDISAAGTPGWNRQLQRVLRYGQASQDIQGTN